MGDGVIVDTNISENPTNYLSLLVSLHKESRYTLHTY